MYVEKPNDLQFEVEGAVDRNMCVFISLRKRTVRSLQILIFVGFLLILDL
jgi:hypothetical protein